MLVTEHLPKLLRTAGDISAEWALWQDMPHSELPMERFAAGDG
jgi:IclR family pca regulon transcriptional regulator